MTFSTPQGRTQIYAAMLRAISRQRLSDQQAQTLAGQLEILDNLPAERKASFEAQTVGDWLGIQLEPSFITKLKAAKAFPSDAVDLDHYQQRMSQPTAVPGVTEMFPDFTVNERFFYVSRQLSSTFRQKDSSLEPGHTYFGGLLFVGWGVPWATGRYLDDARSLASQTVWLTPDGKILFLYYREDLEAYLQGVAWGANGLTLGYATIAVGIASFAAPYLLALGEAGAAAAMTVTTGTVANATTATIPALVTSATGVVIYLGQNWQWIDQAVQATVNLGQSIYETGPDEFLASLNPRRAGSRQALENWASLLFDLLSGAHALGQRSSGGGRGAAATAPTGPEADEPKPPPSPSTPAARAASPPATGEPEPSSTPIPAGSRSIDEPDNTSATPGTRAVAPPQEDAPATATQPSPPTDTQEMARNQQAGAAAIQASRAKAAVKTATARAKVAANAATAKPQNDNEQIKDIRMAMGDPPGRARGTSRPMTSSRGTGSPASGGRTRSTGPKTLGFAARGPGAGLEYPFKPDDQDWRGTGRNVDAAVREAFEKTGVPLSEFKTTEWGKSLEGKTLPVEWTGPRGATVSIDYAHKPKYDKLDNWATGPDAPHVGWQTPKDPDTPTKVGHIILDEVIAGRPFKD
jgi:hypothetical protein